MKALLFRATQAAGLRGPLLAIMLWLSMNQLVHGIIADPQPFEHVQPDGSRINLYLRGDEFFHWHEDTNGFTVVLQNGRYVYARLNAQNQLVPTPWQAGGVDPLTVGLAPRALPPRELRPQNLNRESAPYRPWAAAKGLPGKKVAANGTVRNLVILCKFSDHTLGVQTRAPGDYNVLFNQIGGDPVLAPTGSVRDAYKENSYGIVDLQSTVLAWVTLPQPMAYYAGTNNGLGGDYPNNAKKMIQDALALADGLVDFGQFDTDNDGYVDAIDIIHSGYGAEQGGAPANSIWSHKSNLPSDWVSADNNGNGVKVKVNLYHTEPALFGTSGTNITRIGVVCHETGHFFGLPDLYDTDSSSDGIGSWCMMANSWGFSGDQLNPPHYSAWCKIFLGWTSAYEPVDAGNYFLSEAEIFSHAAKITRGFPPGEYLLIENRQPVGLDRNIPQGGLAIWHIDENVGGNTQEGFPGQPGWPGNGNHYKVALLQADGNYDLERTFHASASGRGDGGDMYRGGGKDKLGVSTIPSTDSYQGGAVFPTLNIISHITVPGLSMGFHYSRGQYVDKFYTGPVTDGSWGHPFRRVTDAYNSAESGDTVVVRAADYFEAPLNNLAKQVDMDSLFGATSVR